MDSTYFEDQKCEVQEFKKTDNMMMTDFSKNSGESFDADFHSSQYCDLKKQKPFGIARFC